MFNVKHAFGGKRNLPVLLALRERVAPVLIAIFGLQKGAPIGDAKILLLFRHQHNTEQDGGGEETTIVSRSKIIFFVYLSLAIPPTQANPVVSSSIID